MDMFNDIQVNRYVDATRTQFDRVVRVPLMVSYNKNFANWWRNQQTAGYAQPIPLGALRYLRKEPNSAGRTQTTYARKIFSKATERWISDIQPTPYFLYYTMEFICDNLSDFHQINENITPYFNTFRTLRIKEFDFAPDLERKIPVYLQSVEDKMEDELDNNSAKQRLYTIAYTFRLEVDWYRPFEIADVIKYAELNMTVDEFTDTLQLFVYPEPVAQQIKQPWETVTPTQIEGYSLLKTNAKSVVRECVIDADGVFRVGWEGPIPEDWRVAYKDITPPDAIRVAGVPSWSMLKLNFDVDSDVQADESYFGRDFIAINGQRDFIPDLAPGAGQYAASGFAVDPNVQWDKILDWFGSNDGLNGIPYTFSITCQFRDNPPADTLFQYLSNDETTTKNKKTIIPKGEVYFQWGMEDNHLFFEFKTFGGNALYYRFVGKREFTLNNCDIYTFSFALYEGGNAGVFAFQVGGGPTVIVEADRFDLRSQNDCS